MPPKAKISKEMIVNAALEIARLTGAENINARTVSQKLNCSTQPIMYHFKTIEDLKKATYQKADEYHTTYLSRIEEITLCWESEWRIFALRQTSLYCFASCFNPTAFQEKALWN